MDSYGRDAWETGPDDYTAPDYHDPIYGDESDATDPTGPYRAYPRWAATEEEA